MLDYSNCPDGGRFYSGAERKKSILIDGNAYLVKFQKNSRDGLRFNHVSEFLGSHIFAMFGIETQETTKSFQVLHFQNVIMHSLELRRELT